MAHLVEIYPYPVTDFEARWVQFWGFPGNNWEVLGKNGGKGKGKMNQDPPRENRFTRFYQNFKNHKEGPFAVKLTLLR